MVIYSKTGQFFVSVYRQTFLDFEMTSNLRGTSPIKLGSWDKHPAYYSQLSPCGHLAITETPIIRTVAKSPANINYRRLTERVSHYDRVSLLTTLTRGPEGVRNKGNCLYLDLNVDVWHMRNGKV